MGAYIEYAKGGTDYRTKSTISCWVKRSELGREQYIWGWGENNSSDSYCRFDAADNLEMHCDGADGTFNSTRLFRDTNAWYHIVFSLDGANATANLRRRLWINGVQIDEGKSAISTFSAAVQGWHSTQDLWIGANARQQQASGHQYFNGLISHFHYCSNNSYAASDFGEFDSITGEWKIKTSPSVNYGSEGFFLKMEDTSNIDLDSSSNAQTLTTTGTVTPTLDCPSNVFAVWNPLNQTNSNMNFTNGNTKLDSSVAWLGQVSTLAMPSGKYYWEIKYGSGNVGCGVGTWGMASTNTNDLSNSNYGYVGKYPGGYELFQNSGQPYKLNNSTNDGNYGSEATAGDIIMVAFDADNNKLFTGINGTWNNSSDPANGTSPMYTVTSGKLYVPSCSIENGSLETNFGNGYFGTTAVSSAGTNASGNGIFEYDVPAGFTALSTKGLNI